MTAGSSLQAALDNAGTGASLCIQEDTYRLTRELRPKTGQTLTFEPGAILNGSRLVTNWTKEGSYWVSSGHTQRFSDAAWLSAHKCDDNPAACVYEDLFVDDEPLTHVLSKSELGPGKVYLDRSASKMYIADDPTGRKVEATAALFGIGVPVDDVTIRGATIEKFGWGGMQVNGSGWTIDRNEIRYAHGRGLALWEGDNHVVTRNYLHHNGNTGLVAASGDNLLFESNDIAYNNYLGFGARPTPHHEGGVKMLRLTNVVVRNNRSHHNDGDGWWFDWENKDVLVEDNFFEHNTRYGFFYEASFDATIRDNVIRDNGTDRTWYGGGIRISTSSNVEIYFNLFDDNKYSTLFANWEDRGAGAYGVFELKNLYVHDNVFVMTRGWVGSSWGKAEIADPAANNRFESNHYLVDDLSRSWWIWTPNGFMDWKKWGSLNFDATGTLSSL